MVDPIILPLLVLRLTLVVLPTGEDGLDMGAIGIDTGDGRVI